MGMKMLRKMHVSYSYSCIRSHAEVLLNSEQIVEGDHACLIKLYIGLFTIDDCMWCHRRTFKLLMHVYVYSYSYNIDVLHSISIAI